MYHPETAFIVLTTECNRFEGCPQCFYNLDPTRACAEAMDTAAVIDVLGKLRLTGVGNIIFTGGEPTIRPDLPKLVAAAAGMGFQILLLTNGLLLDKALVADLERAGLRAVALTLCELNQSEHAASNLLKESGAISLSFIYCFSKHNYEGIPEAADFAARAGCPITFQPAYIPAGHHLEKQLSLRKIGPFEWSRIYTMLRPWAKSSGLQTYLRMMYDFYHEPNIKPERCSMSGSALVIDADGSMAPCFHRPDLNCGAATGEEFSFALKKLRSVYPETMPAPCFGEHCISLHTAV